MSAETENGGVLEPIPAREHELETLANDLRCIADQIDPDDWMHDRWGRPL